MENLKLKVATKRLEHVVDNLQDEINRNEIEKKKASPVEMRRQLGEILEKYGIEPAEELIKLATEVDGNGKLVATRSERTKIWTEILQYRMPKLKSVEMSGTVDNTITVVVRKFGGDTIVERDAHPVVDITPRDPVPGEEVLESMVQRKDFSG